MAVPVDPLKPWRSIEVGPYIPVAGFILKLPFRAWAAHTKQEGWNLADEEISTLPLIEAVQKCVYDLQLAKFADNPYLALAVSLCALAVAKYAAIEMLERMAALEKKTEEPGQRNERQRPANASQPGSPAESPAQPNSNPIPRQSPQRTPNPQTMNPGSSMASGRIPASGAASLSSASRTPENHTYLLNDADDVDG
jgi:hypothetical protein